MNFKCSFCPLGTNSIKAGWGYAKLSTPTGTTEVTFCPKHRKEAEVKLDLAFGLPQGQPRQG